MAGKGGGAWKVAYADFVTAMMAFFLVMWITSQNKAVKESIAQYFENPLGTVAEARATSMHGIEGASADAPFKGEQAGPHGTSKDGTGGVYSPDEKDAKNKKGTPPPIRIFERLDRSRTRGTIVVFPEHKATLDAEAHKQLLMLLPQLLGKPNKVEIRGHTAKEPLPPESPYKDEWQLCYARCQATFQFLVANGIERSRIRLTQDGASEPYSKRPWNNYLKSLNSRVEIFAVDELDQKFKASLHEWVGNFDIPPEPEEGESPKAPAKQPAKSADGHGGGHGASGHGGGGHGKTEKPSGHGKTDSHGKSDGHGKTEKPSGHGHH